MVGLYVTSMGEAAGKSTICAGLGRELKAGGKKVGFLKPVAKWSGGIDSDARLMKEILDLEEPVELLCPVSLGVKDLAATADEKEPPWLRSIEEAYAKASQGKEVVLLEGLDDVKAGTDAARIARRIVDALGARAILVVYYEGQLSEDEVLAACAEIGDRLLGVVINGVPEPRMELVKTQVVALLEEKGIRVLGVLPEDRGLSSVTIGELAEHTGGNILNNTEQADDLVESIVVGGLSFDSAVSYLSTRDNMAAVTRGDHADIQMAALNTSARCLVLTGGIDPEPAVMGRALSLETPIVLVEKDTVSTIEALESVLDRSRFGHMKKLERVASLLEDSLDLEAVYQAV